MLRLVLEYDGTQFAGWQRQAQGERTVQGVLGEALARVCGAEAEVEGAGRTDAGVHALAQVVHFDSDAARSERAWRLGANTGLPPDISVVWVREVPAHFHARYGALARSYRYLILNRDSRPGLATGRAMHAAAQVLVGEHDFSAFRAVECQAKSPLRRVDRLAVRRQAEWVAIEVTANAFLHHMVRNITGLLLAVGEGDSPPERVAAVLASRDRKVNAATAPPDGLYLASVQYPAEFGLPGAAADAGPAVDTGNLPQSAMIGRL
jgi:tRNA pseudouridine38-40 synthase